MIIRSQGGKMLLAKIWLPLLCVASGVSLAASRDFPDRGLLLALPFLAAAVFGASLAILESRNGILRYKRLFKWTTVQRDQVLDARIEWSPIIGSIRLKKFVPPWGKLYFVLDANAEPNPFRSGKYALLCSIDKSITQGSNSKETVIQGVRTGRVQMLKVVAACLAGAIFGYLTELVRLKSVSRHELSGPGVHGPAVIQAMWKLIRLLQHPEVVGILFVVCAVITVFRYRRQDAWIFAFLAGVSVPHILMYWLRS